MSDGLEDARGVYVDTHAFSMNNIPAESSCFGSSWSVRGNCRPAGHGNGRRPRESEWEMPRDEFDGGDVGTRLSDATMVSHDHGKHANKLHKYGQCNGSTSNVTLWPLLPRTIPGYPRNLG